MQTTIESPCIGLCTLNEKDVCLGCGRNVTEIQGWQSRNVEEKLQILSKADERVACLEQLSPSLAEARKNKIESLRQDVRNNRFKR